MSEGQLKPIDSNKIYCYVYSVYITGITKNDVLFLDGVKQHQMSVLIRSYLGMVMIFIQLIALVIHIL